jgi:hypothetical protein
LSRGEGLGGKNALALRENIVGGYVFGNRILWVPALFFQPNYGDIGACGGKALIFQRESVGCYERIDGGNVARERVVGECFALYCQVVKWIHVMLHIQVALKSFFIIIFKYKKMSAIFNYVCQRHQLS